MEISSTRPYSCYQEISAQYHVLPAVHILATLQLYQCTAPVKVMSALYPTDPDYRFAIISLPSGLLPKFYLTHFSPKYIIFYNIG